MTLLALVLWAITNDRLPSLVAEKQDVKVAEVSPVGWRRTVNGWERAEDWVKPAFASHRSINQWIAIQHAYEPLTARSILASIRSVHPLVYSIALLLFVLGIVMLHEPTVKAFLTRATASRR